MRIQVNSDKTIAMDTAVTRFLGEEVNRALARFKDRLTRVEVHLSDVNSSKFGKVDKRCLIEARPAGQRPLAVTMGAATVESAVRGSLSKLRRALETLFGRMSKVPPIAHRAKSGSVSWGAGAKKAMTKRGTGGAVQGAAPRRKRAAAGAKPTKRAAAKKVAAKEIATEQFARSGRSPKKKGIYQARRKSWPGR